MNSVFKRAAFLLVAAICFGCTMDAGIGHTAASAGNPSQNDALEIKIACYRYVLTVSGYSDSNRADLSIFLDGDVWEQRRYRDAFKTLKGLKEDQRLVFQDKLGVVRDSSNGHEAAHLYVREIEIDGEKAVAYYGATRSSLGGFGGKAVLHRQGRQWVLDSIKEGFSS